MHRKQMQAGLLHASVVQGRTLQQVAAHQRVLLLQLLLQHLWGPQMAGAVAMRTSR